MDILVSPGFRYKLTSSFSCIRTYLPVRIPAYVSINNLVYVHNNTPSIIETHLLVPIRILT